MSTFFEGELILGSTEITLTVSHPTGTTTAYTCPSGRWAKVFVAISVTNSGVARVYDSTAARNAVLAAGDHNLILTAGQTIQLTAPSSGDSVTAIGSATSYDIP